MRSTICKLTVFVVECVSVGVFAVLCFLAQALPKLIVGGPSSPADAGFLPVAAAAFFFLLQRRRTRDIYSNASLRGAAVTAAFFRYQVRRLFIPATIAISTWYGIYLRGVTPNGAALLGLAASACLAWLIQSSGGTRVTRLRGTELLSYATAQAKVSFQVGPGEETLVWGGLRLPERASEGNFGAVGASGSGKSKTLQHLMQSVLPLVGVRRDTRALVYDAKRDMLSLLSGMNLSCPVIILNPFDGRSVAWDMARDLTDPAATREIAEILIPDKANDQNPFYTRAAQAAFAATLKSFILKSPGAWTLRDALNVTASPKRLRRVLSATPETESVVEQIFKPPDTLRNTLQTIAAATAALEPVAALWSHNKRQFSLAEWVSADSILVLGTDWTYSKTLKAINRVLFYRLTQLVLNQPESRSRRTWFFIDELKEAGNLDGLPSLLSFGRSKGVRVAVAFQDIEGLRRSDVYGEKAANEMLGLLANKSILRLDSEVTAGWASQVIGEELGVERTKTRGKDGTTEVEHVYKREAVLASELMRFPPADATAFSGVHIVPSVGVYSVRWPYQHGLCPPGPVESFLPRPAVEQLLPVWNVEDERRLFGSAPDEPPPGPATEPTPPPDEPSPLASISRISRTSLRPSTD